MALPLLLTFLSLISAHSHQSPTITADSSSRPSRFRALFSFHAPSALFPSSAIISLTDDNSTFFLAKPAAFGPVLPSRGLSGQLWIGSGFGDDNLHRGGVAAGVEGELGCSDVPGWDQKYVDEKDQSKVSKGVSGDQGKENDGASKSKDGKQKRAEAGNSAANEKDQVKGNSSPEKDGTDDHLHHPLPDSKFSSPMKPGQAADHEPINSKPPTHADIQSLQESAEIAGKIVLLSRGGCGFLEKVKWAQRRGGVALIVGDDTRGDLITMYARGDTSNVTIPALFTSHTTAHLLSTLIPPEEDPEEAAKSGPEDDKVGQNKKGGKASGDGSNTVKPGAGKKSGSFRSATAASRSRGKASKNSESRLEAEQTDGWLRSFLSALGLSGRSTKGNMQEDSRRPPSSGNLDWVLLEDWFDDNPTATAKKTKPKATSKAGAGRKRPKPSPTPGSSKSGDGFVIGVQDWRDPDLVPSEGQMPDGATKDSKVVGQEKGQVVGGSSPPKATSDAQPNSKSGNSHKLTGGSITPGSGEYENPGHPPFKGDSNKVNTEASKNEEHYSDTDEEDDDEWWFSRFGWKEEEVEPGSKDSNNGPPTGDENENDENDDHEGLWVTLTPTSMSSSPFLDTLLVLVVSPLVTLTVVYALLLLRSRIRRRRWRAPKSVVDRLPVRTYHTIPTPSSGTSSQSSTPNTSSPTSPLLRSSPRSVRPRSQTISGVPQASSVPQDTQTSRSPQHREKTLSSSSPWKRRYTGKQVECVVCLEEYIDGQSQVMSLPCGHEFHAECM